MRRSAVGSHAWVSVSGWGRWRTTGAGRAWTVAVAASLVAGLLVVPSSGGVQAAPAPAKTAADGPLERPDEDSALVTARMTGKRVKITSLTTETDQAWARPDGTVLREHRYRPVRLRRDGRWVPVDTTLQVRADGTVAPRTAAVDVAFSGGGDTPLVTLADKGDRIAFSSPLGNLPKPVLDGDTAIYPEVLPGVDLQVHADVDGFTQTLVVRNAQAAKNPALNKLTFATDRDGLAVTADKAGNLDVVDSSDGSVAFTGATPMMWDAEADPATITQAGTVSRDADADTVAMPVTVTSGAVSVTPSQTLLDDPDTDFPVYIDPGFTAARKAWALVRSGTPNTAYWNYPYNARIGSEDDGANKFRAFFTMDIADAGWAGQYLVSAKLDLDVLLSSSCTKTNIRVYSLSAAPTSATTWNNQPALDTLLTQVASNMGSDCAAQGTVSADITAHARTAQANHASTLSLGVTAPSEIHGSYFKRLGNNPTMTVVYTAYPELSYSGTDPATSCDTGFERPYVGTTTPYLKATYTDIDTSTVNTTFEWWNSSEGRRIGATTMTSVPVDMPAIARIPAGDLRHGGVYKWRTQASDGVAMSPWSQWCEFAMDVRTPVIQSQDFPSQDWAGEANTPGLFQFNPSSMEDVTEYLYSLNVSPPMTTVTTSDGTASVTICPPVNGPHILYVRSKNSSGELSPIAQYAFGVGSGIADVTLLSEDLPDVLPGSVVSAKLLEGGATAEEALSVSIGAAEPASPSYGMPDPVSSIPGADYAAAADEAIAAGAPAGSYNIVASWQRPMGEIMILRNGYYIAPNTGFGSQKVVQKHGLTVRTLRKASTIGTRFSTSGQKYQYRAVANRVRCSGWGPWRKCRVVERTGIVSAHDFRKLQDNYSFGIVTAYCDTYVGRCPIWVNKV